MLGSGVITKDELRLKALSLPLLPGVYIMMDKSGQVIYVGKAKALRNRVTQYFQGGSTHSPKTAAMVSMVFEFDTIVAATEFEALVLECSLIKRHQPKYNILLKDGKGYPFIRVPKEPYARFSMVGRKGDDDARYLGPYGGRKVAAQVMAALSEALKLPTCERKFPRDIGKERPCLQHHLGRCIAPCRGHISEQEYQERIEQAVQLMEGKHSKLLTELEANMLKAAEDLLFEKAATLRDRMNAISKLSSRQKVVASGMADMDVVGQYANNSKTCVAVLHFLKGELFSRDIVWLPPDFPEAELISDFLKQYYGTRTAIPPKVLLPCQIEDAEVVSLLLSQNAQRSVKLLVPQRGDEHARVKLACVNAREELERVTTKEEREQGLLKELQRAMNLEKPIHRMEAYDISNTGTSHRVGAMTVFVDGEPRKRDYRLFAIKDESIQDDFHAMQEVLQRRFHRLQQQDEKFLAMPDVLLIDGGAVHANMVCRVLEPMGISVPVFGMVKDHRHRTRALVTRYDEEIGLTHNPALFAMIGKIQEETHRFAITFHQKKRDKSNLESVLTQIPGVGPARLTALRAHFKTIKAIKAAETDALAQVVPYETAKLIYQKFHPKEAAECVSLLVPQKDENSKC